MVAAQADEVGVEEGEAIENKLLTRVIENAQKKVEARNFDIRKHLLEYDDVMNRQREEIYGLRREILEGSRTREYVMEKAGDIVADVVNQHAGKQLDPTDWSVDELVAQMDSLDAQLESAESAAEEGA